MDISTFVFHLRVSVNVWELTSDILVQAHSEVLATDKAQAPEYPPKGSHLPSVPIEVS